MTYRHDQDLWFNACSISTGIAEIFVKLFWTKIVDGFTYYLVISLLWHRKVQAGSIRLPAGFAMVSSSSCKSLCRTW